MNIIVCGATGHIGSLLVPELRTHGHAVTEISRTTVDLTQQRLPVDGVDTIIDVTDAPYRNAHTLPRMAHNIVDSCHEAEATPHIICLGIVGQHQSKFPYYQRKEQQHRVYADSGLPYTAVRCAQFHSFLAMLLDAASPLPIGLLPTYARWQPIDSRDVAKHLANLPEPGFFTLVGPEMLNSKEVAKRHGKPRLLVPFGAGLGSFLKQGLNLADNPNARGTLRFPGDD